MSFAGLRRLIIGIPVWLVVGVFAVPPVAYSLLVAQLPIELVVSLAVAMEVVFLSQAVQQAARRAENRRHFGFALWELYQELSQHLEALDDRLALVRLSVNSEPRTDALRTWASSVEDFPTDAWDRFLAFGGLHRLLDSAPDQVAANLYRYFNGVRSFNNEAALRERLLQKLFTVTGPATTGIFKGVKASDKRLEGWLLEVPPRLAILMRDLQGVLRELGGMPPVIVSEEDAEKLIPITPKDQEEYRRWRERYRDVPRRLSKIVRYVPSLLRTRH
jgi:hypothetical protein